MDLWEIVIIGAAFIILTVFLILVHRAEGTISKPLPALDRTPRIATMIGSREVPQARIYSNSGAPDDLRAVEVEYLDDAGTVRRETSADLFAGGELDRFTVGSTWQVYGFEKPHGRCLLSEAHDDLPRRGYNLDGLRVPTERQSFFPRTGSPILGVMSFANDTTHGLQRVRGPRTSWPGDPVSAWTQAATTATPIKRPRPTPAEILTYRATPHPRSHRETPEHETDTAILCEVLPSPLTIPSGDVDTTTKILIDVRIPHAQAARIIQAFTTWGSRPQSHAAWGPEPGWVIYYTLTSLELFGEEAGGGYISRVCSTEPGQWVLISPSDSDEYPDAPYRASTPTPVAYPKRNAHRKTNR